jgi:hypothetical protein
MRSSKETCCAFDNAETLEEALVFTKQKKVLGDEDHGKEQRERGVFAEDGRLMVIFRY